MSEENIVDVPQNGQPQTQKPTVPQAINILIQASEMFRGSRQDFKAIDAAVEVLQEHVAEKFPSEK